MRYRFAVEDMEPDHWVAWSLDLPGCYSAGSTEAQAVGLAPERIGAYRQRLVARGVSGWPLAGPIDVEVVERFRAFACAHDPDYLVNAFFEYDRRPLDGTEISLALQLLAWNRQALLELVGGLGPEELAASVADRNDWRVSHILAHIAGAENWYFGHLDMDLHTLPEEPLARLAAARANTVDRLAQLIGIERITLNCDEKWSPRKVLRRTLWHEQDHTQQLAKLLQGR
ncbi:MAG: hypothetical protein R3272_03900 [Candidatus Promineifilaceae bacterium]|nr:hypothetical protein [Candidatus Promineifilaceae bacterium]